MSSVDAAEVLNNKGDGANCDLQPAAPCRDCESQGPTEARGANAKAELTKKGSVEPSVEPG